MWLSWSTSLLLVFMISNVYFKHPPYCKLMLMFEGSRWSLLEPVLSRALSNPSAITGTAGWTQLGRCCGQVQLYVFLFVNVFVSSICFAIPVCTLMYTYGYGTLAIYARTLHIKHAFWNRGCFHFCCWCSWSTLRDHLSKDLHRAMSIRQNYGRLDD